ncbi:hypothetical protein [uncultured Tyzzerella sp.]|uniref:hypothetical protein n=1 Tax=uncultured Tyzzerella sp. TaxID=2321398 RepID=UPI002941FD58|nr:hypothetical protein [uncultured Tyzzerella sp.]
MNDREKEYSTNNLYMPSNISTEKEILPNISGKELKYFGYLMIFTLVIGVIITIFKGFQVSILIMIAMGIFSYFLVVKNPANNYSTIKQLIGIYNYLKKQNTYKFKYKDWWEEYLDEEENKKEK